MADRQQGICLKFYLPENRRHHGLLLYEWLLEQARKLGLRGGTVFHGIAGFGRHHILHETHFFELAGDTPVEVMFVVNDAEEARLMQLLQAEKLGLFYVRMPVEWGTL
jgi:PII-like signaling protein